MYKGDCAVNELNTKYLLFLAYAFDIDGLKEFMVTEINKTLDDQNLSILILLELLEIGHVFKINKLKQSCIVSINNYGRQLIKTGAWKKIAEKYPKLVLDVFGNK